LALIWGIAPLLVGLCYSIWRAPVLQYSVLLFSFPYSLLLLLSGIQRATWPRTALLCAILSGAAVLTLIIERKHYDLFYRSVFETMIRDGMRAQERFGRNDCVVLLDAPDHM